MKPIFVSSTFRDMQFERDLLQKKVLPMIRSIAREYGESVEFIDLRWGINTDQLTEEEIYKKILEVCFRTIEQSRPYFIGFIGDRYGTTINQDQNIPGVKKEEYFNKSITEAEIIHGPLSSIEEIDCAFFFRKIPNIDDNVKEIYVEDDIENIKKLKELKDNLRSKESEKFRIFDYEAQLDQNVLDLANLDQVIIDVIKDMFKKEFGKLEELNTAQIERRKMSNYMKVLSESFKARNNELKILKKLVNKNNVVIVTGEAGSGKSTLLSKLFTELIEKDELVIPILGGSTSNSTKVEDIIQQQIWFLEGVLDKLISEKPDYYTDKYEIHEHKLKLLELLLEYSKKYSRPITVLIDGLDQFEEDKNRDDFLFLLPNNNLRYVISVLDDMKIPHLELSKVKTLELRDLSKKDKEITIDSTSKFREIIGKLRNTILDKNNSSNPLYLNLIINRLSLIDYSHYLEIYDDIERGLSVDDHLIKIVNESNDSLEDIIVNLIKEAEEIFDKEIIDDILGYLSLSKNGLRYEDLESLIESDKFNQLEFQVIIKYLSALINLQENLFTNFSHRLVKEVVNDYKKTEKRKKNFFEYLESLPDGDQVKEVNYIELLFKTKDFRKIIDYINNIEKEYEPSRAKELIIKDFNKNGAGFLKDLIEKSDITDTNLFKFILNIGLSSFNLTGSNLKSFKEIYKLLERKINRRDFYKYCKNYEALYIRSLVFLNLGIIEYSLGNHKTSLDYFINSKTSMWNLIKFDDPTEYYLILIKIIINLATVYQELNEYEEAQKHFLGVLDWVEKLESWNVDFSELRDSDTLALIGLGRLVKEQDEYKAFELLKAGLELQTNEDENNYYNIELASTLLHEIAKILEDKNKERALECYERSLNLIQVLYDEFKTSKNLQSLSEIYFDYGNFLLNYNRTKGSKYLKKAQELLSSQDKVYDEKRKNNIRIESQFKIGQRYLESKNKYDYKKAEKIFKSLINDIEQVGVDLDVKNYLNFLGDTYYNLHLAYKLQKRNFKAVEALKKAVEITKQFYDINKKETTFELYGFYISLLGQLQLEIGFEEQGIVNLEIGTKILSDITEPAPLSLELLLTSYRKLKEFYSSMDLEKADRYEIKEEMLLKKIRN